MIQVTDIDSNVYDTVQIGNQVWLTENLKVTKFRNGDAITEHTNNAWFEPTYIRRIPSQLFFPGYGQYYNPNAIQDQRMLAPKGCRIPTTKDFDELENYITNVYGSNIPKSNAVRSTRVQPTDVHPRWDSSPWTANNGSGLSVLPSGVITLDVTLPDYVGYASIILQEVGVLTQLAGNNIYGYDDYFPFFGVEIVGVAPSAYSGGANYDPELAAMKVFRPVRCILDTKIIMIQ